MPLASVYPLVSTRSLARPFTYEVPEGTGKGAVVSVRLGRQSVRGVVADVGVDAPPGVEPSPSARSSTRSRRRSSTSRSGSPTTTARRRRGRSSSSRPARRAPRGERPSPAARDALDGEPEPASLTDRPGGRVERIVAALDEGVGEHVLLEGPTGSGKTEVYLQACAAALERGLGTIVLVPEIALAPQTVGRFRQRFGDIVAILHSSLGDAERRDERDRIARGEARIVVGARSAMFAAMRGVGLIVVDEEHDSALQAGVRPALRRAHGRREARRARRRGRRLRLRHPATRELVAAPPVVPLGAHRRPMPRVRLVDLRRETGYPLSAPLLGALGGLVEDGGRAVLLLNRRGVAPAVHCRACGVSRRCDSATSP